ncbi:protein-arginine deiminase domain-containing protein [Streptomyces somaliensis DSM 40738]|uniref:protein-arginine deiminase domain-containing protein n=1 Tax=Streptomyces somaliensis TaxID=78355 RepID=UPI0021C2A840|nr:protein-arginine deiminase domain-containing protein [Streptomyces somaliensis]MCQ0025511.1 protein-arginine deiminase domain-containing protein [Streptomyces somaliensis DSM 40738]
MKGHTVRTTSHTRRATVALSVVAAVLAPAAPAVATGPPPRADLRADVDRDGRTDVAGTTDEAGEDTWTPARGAVLLPNIDDDATRCPTKDPRGGPLSDARLAACNDASDTKVNGTSDARDLARVRSVPMKGLPASASGTLRVVGGARNTRVFVGRGGGWARVTAATRLTAAELRAGVEFGVEATDVVRDPALWGGRAVLRLTVTSGDSSTSDDVTLRTAPLLTHHHLQDARRILVTRLSGTDPFSRRQRAFVRGLTEEARAAGIGGAPFTFDRYEDIWAQDFVEPGYVSMAGPGGRPQFIRVMLRSAQPDRPAGRELFERMRGKGVGVVQVSGVRESEEWTLNSMGNLETVPPHTHAGRSFPAGRIIMGERRDDGSKPARAMRTLLRAQGVQDPLFLDTSWLHVGHVDEFVQFLPAPGTPRGWRIAVADPEAGLGLLRDAQEAGHGGTRMFSVPESEYLTAPKETIDQALGSKWLVADNTLAARRIRANLEVLKRETGVTDAEVVRVPALYTRGTEQGEHGDRVPRLTRLGAGEVPEAIGEYGQQKRLTRAGDRVAGPGSTAMTSAYVPGAVNGVLMGRDRYLAPKQWGPVIGGRDVFTDAVTAAYARAGLKVSYIDDWDTYHLGMGEVHCGTNTLRDASAPWWVR